MEALSFNTSSPKVCTPFRQQIVSDFRKEEASEMSASSHFATFYLNFFPFFFIFSGIPL